MIDSFNVGKDVVEDEACMGGAVSFLETLEVIEFVLINEQKNLAFDVQRHEGCFFVIFFKSGFCVLHQDFRLIEEAFHFGRGFTGISMRENQAVPSMQRQ